MSFHSPEIDVFAVNNYRAPAEAVMVVLGFDCSGMGKGASMLPELPMSSLASTKVPRPERSEVLTNLDVRGGRDGKKVNTHRRRCHSLVSYL